MKVFVFVFEILLKVFVFVFKYICIWEYMYLILWKVLYLNTFQCIWPHVWIQSLYPLCTLIWLIQSLYPLCTFIWLIQSLYPLCTLIWLIQSLYPLYKCTQGMPWFICLYAVCPPCPYTLLTIAKTRQLSLPRSPANRFKI